MPIDKFQQDLQKNYLSLKKVSEQIKKDYLKVKNEEFQEKDWNNEGKKITTNMRNFEKLMKDLNKKIEYAKNEYMNNSNVNDIVEKVESEVQNAQTNIEPMLGVIREKVKTYACDFQLAVNNEPEKEEKGQELVMDLMNNKDILMERRKNLEDIHKTAAQMKEITDKMAADLNNQGALLNEVENKVVETEENAKKAKKEITDADKISKSNRKCVIFYIIIILAALSGIGFGIWGFIRFYQNSHKKK